MASQTTRIKLAKPANGDGGWDVSLNANADAIDAIAAVGSLAVSPKESPSTSLNVAVAAGDYIKSTGVLGSYAGTTSQALTTATTNYIYILESTGVLTVNTTGFPTGTTKHVRLATAVAGSTTVTSVTDRRITFSSLSVS